MMSYIVFAVQILDVRFYIVEVPFQLQKFPKYEASWIKWISSTRHLIDCERSGLNECRNSCTDASDDVGDARETLPRTPPRIAHPKVTPCIKCFS